MDAQKALRLSELRRRYEEDGRSLKQLAVEYGVSSSAIRRDLVAAGTTMRPIEVGRAQRSRDQRKEVPLEEIRRAYEHDGASIADLADRFGTSSTTMRRRLTEAGASIRTARSYEHAAIVARRSAGISEPPGLKVQAKTRLTRSLDLPMTEIRRKYETDLVSLGELALEFEVTLRTMREQLVGAGAHIRTAREAAHARRGKPVNRPAAAGPSDSANTIVGRARVAHPGYGKKYG